MNTKICKDGWRDERLYVKMKIFIFFFFKKLEFLKELLAVA